MPFGVLDIGEVGVTLPPSLGAPGGPGVGGIRAPWNGLRRPLPDAGPPPAAVLSDPDPVRPLARPGVPSVRAPWNGLRRPLWDYTPAGPVVPSNPPTGPELPRQRPNPPFRSPASIPRQLQTYVNQPPPPPPPPPSRFGAGQFKPFVPRDPVPDHRMRRHTEAVAVILNSLLGAGDIRQTGVAEFRVSRAPYRIGRPPGADDDADDGVEPGDVWIDTSAPAVYMNAVNTAGAAVWVRLGG